MTYRQAIAYLDSLIDYERRPLPEQARAWNLDRTRALLAAVGNPHQSLRTIHIAGTKGKGSTAAFIAPILRAAGHRVGLYTSPHLVDFRERIRLEGVCIPKRDVARLVAELMPHVEILKKKLPFPPSFFEVYTALALRWFADKKVDFAVLETGLGGRLDATNVVTPLVSIITTIGLDHTVELGPTISHIAREKAGIIKPGVPVICAPQRRDAFRQIAQACRRLRAPLYSLRVTNGASVVAQVSNLFASRPSCRAGVPTPAASRHFLLPPASQTLPPPLWGRVGVGGRGGGARYGQHLLFTGLDGKTRHFHIPFLGSPQVINASLACACTQLLGIRTSAIRSGLSSARWPGRFHVIPGAPTIVLDCAHDGISAVALARDISAAFPTADITLVLGISSDKDASAIIRPLSRIATRVITTRAKLPRAADPLALARLVQRLRAGAGSPEPAAQRARSPATPRIEAITPVSKALHRALSLVRPVGRARPRPPCSSVGRGFHSPPPSSCHSEPSGFAQGKLSEEPHVILITGSVYVVGEAMHALDISPCDLPL
jgi:dihydrofolate synthase/folylpolyglutamate synthase